MNNDLSANLENKTVAGRYRIDGPPHHIGGFAYIYRAVDLRAVNRSVAVKVLHNKYANDHEWRSQFRSEAISLNHVNGSNVVVFHELIESDPATGLDFLIMEWIDGQNLADYRRSSTNFSSEELLNLATGISAGVHRIHSRGIAHGDITPKNIMFREDQTPVIIDFGLSWDVADPDVMNDSPPGGTILYLAPEQFALGPSRQSQNADIYSLGVVLYFLMVGQYYFPQLKSEIEIIEKQYGNSVSLRGYTQRLGHIWGQRSVQSIDVKLPKLLQQQLNDLILSMLALDPSQRPSAEVVHEQLKQIQRARANQDQHFVFPLEARDYSVVIASYGDRLLSDDRHSLTARKHHEQWVFETDDLFLIPNQKNCHGILLHNDRIIYTGLYDVTEEPFRFFLPTSSLDNKIKLEITRGSLTRQTNLTLKECDFQYEVTAKKTLQLALLIDGTMSETEINSVWYLLENLFNSIQSRRYEAKVAIVIYGDYQSHPGNRPGWKVPFVTLSQKFTILEKGWEFLSTHMKLHNFNGKGYSGSLEFGLLQLSNMAWESATSKYLIIIGSSPPHPTCIEREDFKLVDFTIEEYYYQDQDDLIRIPAWSNSLHAIRAQNISCQGIWIRPSDFDISQGIQGYIDRVWGEFNRHRMSTLFPHTTIEQDVSSVLSWIDSTIRPIPIIDNMESFPLLSHIDTI